MNSLQVELLETVLGFMRSPSEDTPHKISTIEIFKKLVILIAWVYAIVFPMGLMINYVLDIFNYDGINSVEQFTSTSDFWLVIFMGGVLAPVLEELAFRLALRFRPIYIFIGTFFVFRIITVYFIRSGYPVSVYLHEWLTPFILSGIVYVIVGSKQMRDRINDVYKNNYRTIFYGISVLFGLMHITNYSDVSNILVIALLLGMPQIIVGLVLGFVRIRYGFLYAVVMHSLYNSLLLIPSALAQTTEKSGYTTIAGLFAIVVLILFVYGLVSLFKSSYYLVKLNHASP